MPVYEDEKLLRRLADKIKKLIDRELDADRDYFLVHLTVDVLGSSFNKLEEHTLIDEGKNFCDFCGNQTGFYDEKRGLHLCPSCYAEIEMKSGMHRSRA